MQECNVARRKGETSYIGGMLLGPDLRGPSTACFVICQAIHVRFQLNALKHRAFFDGYARQGGDSTSTARTKEHGKQSEVKMPTFGF